MNTRIYALFARIAVAALAFASLPTVSNAQYSLFRPVPSSRLRDMSTDRPDKTESPFTVDAGHAQLELDLVTWSMDIPGQAQRVHNAAFIPVNAKLGLGSRADLQLIFEPVTFERIRNGHTTSSSFSAGEFAARLKYNLWGNDGGKTAFGIMPFVSLTPTDAGRVVQGGVILPLAAELAEGWGLGMMVETDFVAEEGRSGRKTVFIYSVTVSHELSDRLGTYGEIYTEAARRQSFISTADTGLTFAITPNVQLDGGINVGLTRAADNVNPFLGFSIRF